MYAVALVASEMMVGKSVPEGYDVVQLEFATANPTRRPTPAALGVPISEDFKAVLHRALEVDPVVSEYPSRRDSSTKLVMQTVWNVAREWPIVVAS